MPPPSASAAISQATTPRDVAVIGAGISGVATAAHLLRRGLNVAVFERSGIAGGVWHFDSRAPPEPPYPNEHPPQTNHRREGGATHLGQCDDDGATAGDFATASLLHAPPSPCYAGLRNNVPTSLMRSVLLQWPEGTEEIIGQDGMERYIQDLAAETGVEKHTLFDTSVDDVWKEAAASFPGVADSRHGHKWNLRSTKLVPQSSRDPTKEVGGERSWRFERKQWQFDAVVVASGHYHESKVPDVPGLSEWKRRWPDAVTHSKAYRTPGQFRDKTVLVVGGGVSSNDIARELHGIATKVYVSTRQGPWDLPVPETAVSVGGILELVPPGHDAEGKGRVVLTSGATLDDVNHIVVATGYLTSYPFLRDLQDPSLAPQDAGEAVIVTGDGILTHNLHRDIWYIPDPTLAFVGVPFHISTFSLFDFQGEVVARVLAGHATLPPEEVLRDEYNARKEAALEAASAEGGGGGGEGNALRGFHSLMGRDIAYMDELREWVNHDARALGVDEMAGVDAAWLERYEIWKVEVAIRRGLLPPPSEEAVEDGDHTATLTVQVVAPLSVAAGA